MTLQKSAAVEDKTREVRLGLVMYGGVSLAIYINGVAAEFFRAVRGRGVYRWIKALTDSDIVVDIISGTSAGGINGILLAYALCNDKDFLSSARLWRRDGDIRSLLRSPRGDVDGSRSLLNSEGYYQPRLEEAFRTMHDYVPEEGEMRSEFSELDLFVTGTDVDGNIYTQFDDAGHAIDVKDHRSVFLLKHRSGRREPFNPDWKEQGCKSPSPEVKYKALAKLARITSCFPAAFAPVHVSQGGCGEDEILTDWGLLDKDSCFLDGGVIDNKPFTYTLKEIFERCANGQIDRKLFYVEPDPEHFNRMEAASDPNIYEAVIASLVGIPGYESISDDLKLLASHNSKLSQYKRLIHALEDCPRQSALSNSQQVVYDQSRLIALSERVVKGILREDGKNRPIHSKDRKAAAALASAFDDLMDRPDIDGPDATVYTKRVLDNFDIYFHRRRGSRIIYLIAEQLYKKTNPVSGELKEKYAKVWREFNRQSMLLDILRLRMEELIDQAPIEWKTLIEKKLDADGQASLCDELSQIWKVVSLAMRNLLGIDEQIEKLLPKAYHEPDKEGWLNQEILSNLNTYLKDSVTPRIIEAIKLNPLDPTLPEPDSNLLSLTESFELQILESIIGDANDLVQSAYSTFRCLDAIVFPIEMIGGLHEKDIIQTIRISPADAEKGFSNKSLADKVSGDALYHFGGFFKRSWRSNDILWGRLDACCQLIESLFDRERLRILLDSAGTRQKLRGYFSANPEQGGALDWRASMDPATLFPRSGLPTHQVLRKWIEQLLSDDASERAGALENKEFTDRICLLIEAAQLEIISEDLPGVITDALEEQAQWNQFRVPKLELDPDPPKQYVGPFVFSPVKGNLDPFVSIIAAAGQAQSVMDKLADPATATPSRPRETKLGKFFLKDYNIGTEALLKDMPSLILLEILSVSLLVLRNCVLGIFGERAEKIKRNPIYLFTLDYPLRLFNALVLFVRRAPTTWKVLLPLFFVLSVIMLTIGITWRESIIYKDGGFDLRWFAIFVAAPIWVLLSQGLFLWRGRVHKVGVRRVGMDLAATLLVFSPLVLLAVAWREIALVYGIISDRLRVTSPNVADELQKAIGNRVASAFLFLFLFIVVVLILGKLSLGRRLRARREKPRDLQYALEDYFDLNNIGRLAEILDIEPNKLQGAPKGPGTIDSQDCAEFLRKMGARQRAQYFRTMAKAIVGWAEKEERVPDLEAAMRAVNPEPLYPL